ncbi:MAG: hypothetical protein ISS19_03580 [Bacteroidales bacterium]|nr:hypothetical protein [Bacteroidales bacterium]
MRHLGVFILFISIWTSANSQDHIIWTPEGTLRHNDRLGRHYIHTDTASNILPWYSQDPGESYDYILNLCWEFWDNIPYVHDGVKYYMMHREWPFSKTYTGIWGGKEDHGIGGDQVQMVLDSWTHWYAYTGNRKVIDNMIYQADFYTNRGLSPSDHDWPSVPYPWHSSLDAGFRYDGDMIDGIDVAHIDKIGDLGYHLINLYKITGIERYLELTETMANTLLDKIEAGDDEKSPFPYKVNTRTGENKWPYTTNWVWTIRMFEELAVLDEDGKKEYDNAAEILRSWLKNHALKNNKYGPFFEDIHDYSECGINAGRLAEYILLYPEKWGDSWQEDARRALDWIWDELKNQVWEKYGVTVINEQTAYPYPGNSHTSRYAYLELLYSRKTNDWSRKINCIRQLNWCTYSVDTEGRNEYPGAPNTNEIWFTDGYGDFFVHYLRAMAQLPCELMPVDADHLISSTSIVKNIEYGDNEITYEVYDNNSTEVLRLTGRPENVTSGDKNPDKNLEWIWDECINGGGILTIRHKDSHRITIIQ